MKLRSPFLVLVIAATGASGLLSISTAHAQIRTGSDGMGVGAPFYPFSVSSTTGVWDVVKANYYSTSYPDPSSWSNSPFWFGPLPAPVSASVTSDSLGSLGLNGAKIPPTSWTAFSSPQWVQFFTGALDLGALVDPAQTFNSFSALVVGGEVKRFGYSVTVPEAPTTLYGWVELDASASTTASLSVIATWAYDTTGAPITVGTVPEPTTLTLVGLGCLALLARYRFGRKQS